MPCLLLHSCHIVVLVFSISPFSLCNGGVENNSHSVWAETEEAILIYVVYFLGLRLYSQFVWQF